MCELPWFMSTVTTSKPTAGASSLRTAFVWLTCLQKVNRRNYDTRGHARYQDSCGSSGLRRYSRRPPKDAREYCRSDGGRNRGELFHRTPQPQIPMARCIWAPLLEFVPDGNGSEAGCGEVFQRFQQRSLIQSRSRIQKLALRFRSRARQLRLCSMRRWPDVPVTSRPGD